MLERIGNDIVDNGKMVAQWHKGAWYVPRGEEMDIATPSEVLRFSRIKRKRTDPAVQEAAARIKVIDGLGLVRSLLRTRT
jgi:hypothetical protein